MKKINKINILLYSFAFFVVALFFYVNIQNSTKEIVGQMYIQECPNCGYEKAEGYECLIKGLESDSLNCPNCNYSVER